MTDVDAASKMPLNSTLLNSAHPLGRVEQVLNVGSRYLVILGCHPERRLHVFTIADLNYLYSWDGPNSWIGNSSPTEDVLLCSPFHNRLTLVNAGFAQLGHYEVTESEIRLVKKESLNYQFRSQPLSGIACLHEKLYIIDNPMNWSNQQSYFALAPDEKEPLYSFGSPMLGQSGIRKPKPVKTLNVAKPDGQMFATLAVESSGIRFFDDHGKMIRELPGSTVTFPELEEVAFIRRAAYGGNDYLYVIINFVEAEYYPGPNNETWVEIWSWQGEPLNLITLDQKLLHFTVIEDHDVLLGCHRSAENTIYKYQINSR